MIHCNTLLISSEVPQLDKKTSDTISFVGSLNADIIRMKKKVSPNKIPIVILNY